MSNSTAELRDCPALGSQGSIEVLEPREVPLGGPRAMNVSRTLPQRARSLVGPWCFVDHFGPAAVSDTGGMVVPRHPHTGLATVSLLFTGKIDHIDSTGFANTVRPGEVNLMIAGRGVSHSEFSTADTTTLHGVQLWYALPDALRSGPPQSQHHVPTPSTIDGATISVYTGALAGITSPVDTRVPALSAEVVVPAGATLTLPVSAEDEHALLIDTGAVHIVDHDEPDVRISRGQLAYVPVGENTITVRAGDAETLRFILLGGRPFGESIVMWWNFVGRTHEEISAFRTRWEAEISAETSGTTPFGPFHADTPAPLHAPELPTARIKPRR